MIYKDKINCLPRLNIGDKAEVDWFDLKVVNFLGFSRRVYLFVMVLCNTRNIFAKASFNMNGDTFARAHINAFSHFEGVPSCCIYINFNNVIKINNKNNLNIDEKFLDFAKDYNFKIKSYDIRQPQTAPRLERAIHWIEKGFMKSRSFTSLEDLNLQLSIWLAKNTKFRKWNF